MIKSKIRRDNRDILLDTFFFNLEGVSKLHSNTDMIIQKITIFSQKNVLNICNFVYISLLRLHNAIIDCKKNIKFRQKINFNNIIVI